MESGKLQGCGRGQSLFCLLEVRGMFGEPYPWRVFSEQLSEVACKASTVRGKCPELGHQAQEGTQFFNVLWLFEFAKCGEFFIVGADTAIRDDVSCELDFPSQFELLS